MFANGSGVLGPLLDEGHLAASARHPRADQPANTARPDHGKFHRLVILTCRKMR
jgi:hypothetical protein